MQYARPLRQLICLLATLLGLGANAEKCGVGATFLYEHAATALTDKQRGELQETVELIRLSQGKLHIDVLILEGHADKSEVPNDGGAAISARRAEFARDVLARIYPDLAPRIHVADKGSTQPIKNIDAAPNRRMEFELICSVVQRPV